MVQRRVALFRPYVQRRPVLEQYRPDQFALAEDRRKPVPLVLPVELYPGGDQQFQDRQGLLRGLSLVDRERRAEWIPTVALAFRVRIGPGCEQQLDQFQVLLERRPAQRV